MIREVFNAALLCYSVYLRIRNSVITIREQQLSAETANSDDCTEFSVLSDPTYG